jgi:hypothetical protein
MVHPNIQFPARQDEFETINLVGNHHFILKKAHHFQQRTLARSPKNLQPVFPCPTLFCWIVFKQPAHYLFLWVSLNLLERDRFTGFHFDCEFPREKTSGNLVGIYF